jgi:hypothetical protein
MKSRVVISALAALALWAVAVAAQATQLVTNGSFETLTNGYGQIGYNTNATGWTTTGYNFVFNASNATSGVPGYYNPVSLWGTANGGVNPITASPDGGNFIAADGAYEVGAISQTINGLTAGQKYSVSFYWAAAQQYTYNGATTDMWTVDLASSALTSNTQAGSQSTSITNLASHAFSGWQYDTMTFTATAATDVLSFLSTGTPSGVPPFALLDGVSMVAVPEPSGAALMIVGVLALAGLRIARRRWA